MLQTRTLIFLMVFVLPLFSTAQHTLTVKVEGVETSKGLIAVGIYDSDQTWLNEDTFFTGAFEQAKKGVTTIKFTDIPEGTYAISLYHDENGDKELDKNMLGIPKEPLGFSIGKLKTFGPPSFEECSFEVKTDFEIRIPVE